VTSFGRDESYVALGAGKSRRQVASAKRGLVFIKGAKLKGEKGGKYACLETDITLQKSQHSPQGGGGNWRSKVKVWIPPP